MAELLDDVGGELGSRRPGARAQQRKPFDGARVRRDEVELILRARPVSLEKRHEPRGRYPRTRQHYRGRGVRFDLRVARMTELEQVLKGARIDDHEARIGADRE